MVPQPLSNRFTSILRFVFEYKTHFENAQIFRVRARYAARPTQSFYTCGPLPNLVEYPCSNLSTANVDRLLYH